MSETTAGNARPTDHPLQEPGSPAGAQQLPPPPRVVRRRPGRRRVLSHVPLTVRLLSLAGAGLLLLSLGRVVSTWLVARFGVTVPGAVTGKSPATTKNNRVEFTYHVKGQEYSAEDTVDEDTFGWLHVGTPVKVRVLAAWPRQPLLVEPAGQAGRDDGIYLWLAILANVGLGIVLWAYLRAPLRRRALVRVGIATEGVVVGKEVGAGKRPSWFVQYSYRAPRHGVTYDAAVTGSSAVPEKEWQVLMGVARKDFDAAEVGAGVTVLYDPRKPSRSVIYAYAEHEVVSS
jgi:hypothetical protein